MAKPKFNREDWVLAHQSLKLLEDEIHYFITNYFLENRRLQFEYKYPGFQALAANGGVACAKKIPNLSRG
ncbi:hypothetical protein ISS42_01855 [Candidatus Shapirobacteria bacterium]|nr:hypothetical protein [Candidatus Shapirobacteria bacterium]